MWLALQGWEVVLWPWNEVPSDVCWLQHQLRLLNGSHKPNEMPGVRLCRVLDRVWTLPGEPSVRLYWVSLTVVWFNVVPFLLFSRVTFQPECPLWSDVCFEDTSLAD